MAKETHTIRVWALRGRRRELALSLDSPSAREDALLMVADLKRDTTVDRIDLEEYFVLTEDANGRLPAPRGTMHWARRHHGRQGWRRLPDSRH